RDACPLWVKSRHLQCKTSCLLYPQKRHQMRHNRMSAKGEKRTSGGTLDPRIDLTAKRRKVDGLGQKCVGTVFQRFALCVSIAIGRDHDDRNVRSSGLRFGQEFKSGHPRHINVGQNENEGDAAGISNAAKSNVSRLRKFHRETTLAQVAPEMRAEQ